RPHQPASYPSSAKSPRTRPSARRGGSPGSPTQNSQDSTSPAVASALSAPLTFSHKTRDGRMMSMASHMDAQRPDRVPSFMPARLPACERSWQGEPPVMMSTGSTADQ